MKMLEILHTNWNWNIIVECRFNGNFFTILMCTIFNMLMRNSQIRLYAAITWMYTKYV